MSPKAERLILVLEDSDEDFDTVLEALKNAGFRHELRRAATGDDFLELLRGNGASPLPPCIILLDLNTPGLDSRHALREIKMDTRLKILPIVIFTTSSNPRDLEYCYHQGANAYHVKPVRVPGVPEHLDRNIHLLA